MGFFDPFGGAADVGELKSDLSSLKSDVETHTNNNDIHVTASDKSNWNSKLDKNQGTENSGKVLGTNANGEVIPLNGYGFEYDEETKMLKYGTDPTTNLNQGIGLDDTLSKRGYAADAGAVSELKEDLNDVENKMSELFEMEDEISQFTSGGYIATNKTLSQIVSLTPVDNAAYQYAIIDCKADDVFVVTGTGGGTPRLWAFVDDTNKLISVASEAISVKNLLLKAPETSAKLIVNASINSVSYPLSCHRITSKTVADWFISEKDITAYVSRYINLSGDVVPHTFENGNMVFTTQNNYGFVCGIVPVEYGDMVTITGVGGASYRLWAFVSDDGTIISKADANATATGLNLIVPKNAVYLIVNVYSSHEHSVNVNSNIFYKSQLERGNVEFKSGYITTPYVGSMVDLTPVSSDTFVYALVECVKGESITLTGFSDGNSGRAVYSFIDFTGRIRVRYLDTTYVVNNTLIAPLHGYLLVNCYKDQAHYIKTGYNYEISNPLTKLPPAFMGSMSFKPLHNLSKGYICLMTDDGGAGLVSRTIPLAINKNVPFTFSLMKESAVCQDATMLATVKDAVENHGCSIAQHSGVVWEGRTEDWLNTFFDIEQEFWESEGITVKGAVIPGHYTTELIKAVCGGRFGVVRSGYSGMSAETLQQNGSVDNFYSYYTSGGGSNLYGLSSYNNTTAEASYNTAAIDYAFANNTILICYFHENAMTEEQWTKVSNMIDYAITKGLKFITLGDIPHLLNN